MSELPLPRRARALLVDIGPGRDDVLARFPDVYDAQIRFEDPLQVVHGIDAFIETNRRFLGRVRELSFKVSDPVGDDGEFYFSWTMHLAPKFGPRFEVDGVSHAHGRGGKVITQRDTLDTTSLLASGIPGGRALLRLLLRPFA